MFLTLLVMALVALFLLSRDRCRRFKAGFGGVASVPYININRGRSHPKWLGYVILAVLAALTVLVVVLALTLR